MKRNLSIKDRIGSCNFNFESFVKVLQSDGYITEDKYPEDASLSSSYMEKLGLSQEEFDLLFEFFYPNETNDIVLRCLSTNDGCKAGSNVSTYALYNTNVIIESKVKKILIQENISGKN